MVRGICGKCNTEQELDVKSTGPRDSDWCYICPKCEDQIAPSKVRLI